MLPSWAIISNSMMAHLDSFARLPLCIRTRLQGAFLFLLSICFLGHSSSEAFALALAKHIPRGTHQAHLACTPAIPFVHPIAHLPSTGAPFH